MWGLREWFNSITSHYTGCVFVCCLSFITCYLLFFAAEYNVSVMLHQNPSCWWPNKGKALCLSTLPPVFLMNRCFGRPYWTL